MFLTEQMSTLAKFVVVAFIATLLPTDMLASQPVDKMDADASQARRHFQQAWEAQAREVEDCKTAIEHLNKAISLDDSRPEFFHRRAYCWIQLDEYRKALVDLNMALELSEDYIIAYGDRAIVRERLGDIDGAISDYTYAMELGEEPWGYARDRGRLFYEAGQYQQAVSDLKRYLAGLRARFEEFEIEGWSPEEEDAMLLLAKSYLKNDEMESAIETFRSILAANPNQSCAAKQLEKLGIEP